MFHSSFHQAGISKLCGFILLRQLFTENNNLMLANFHSCVETEAEEGENGEERGLINCPAPQFYDFIENVLCASKLLLLCKLEKLDIIIICFLCMTFT